MKRGKFITFEGGEAAGKSTQAKRLAERLERAGISVVVTREPGGTPVGEDVRELIMRDRPTDPVTELLLFAAARAEHVTSVIRPALDDGTWVISDRFMDSTRVYQGKLYGLEPEFIAQLERYTVAPDYPDLTLILDLPASAGVERAQLRGTLSRYDAERIETHETLREGFLEIADAEPLRCVLIDASLSVSSVETAVWQAVSAHLLAEAN
ncbi:dTMP kinase [Hyphomicrobium sp.]|uniref:dTMP kinase n=1 Tax=Hyphomicrobium sp. TaxID=82 RepID=UPI000FAB3A11|nr:dTMP kinase [Hyphomicrobium sp.]RUP10899.1 MAG: dTMP kinase [Hyphomicrobium sp.]